MTPTLLRRLMLSCTATIVLAGAAPAAFAEDRELQEATGFTGTVMYLSGKVPGLIFGAVRGGETALVGFGETPTARARRRTRFRSSASPR